MSAQSGINVCDHVVSAYSSLQLKHKYSYVIFKIDKKLKNVINDNGPDEDEEKREPTEVFGQGKPDAPFEEFVEKLPEKECRYAVVDVKFEAEGGGHREKICFIVWCPETAPIKQKMVYASTKDTLKKKLTGLAAEYQADCLSDMKYCEVLDKVKKSK